MSERAELAARKALVTGGTKGIGEAVAARLREGGATVLTTARTQPGDLVDADLFVAADVATAQGCAAVADAVRSRLGGLDIVVTSLAARPRRRVVSPCSTIRNGSARLTSTCSRPCGWIGLSCR